MKRLILSVLAVFAIAAVVVGCGSSDTSSGNTELQGTWSATPPDEGYSSLIITFTFSGNNWDLTETMASTAVGQMSGTFTLDPTANPKTLDLLVTEFVTDFPDEPEVVGKTWLGLYQLSGTNLTMTFGDEPGAARPTSFTDGMVFIKQ